MPEEDKDNLTDELDGEDSSLPVDQNDTYSPQGVSFDAVKPPSETRGEAEERQLAETRGEKTPRGQDLPGGPAMKEQGEKQTKAPDQQEEQPGGGGIFDRGKQFVSDKVGQVTDKLKQVGKNFLDKIKKEGLKTVAKALMKSPWFWVVVAVLLVIIILVIAFSDSKNPNVDEAGKTETRTVEPLTDKEWIQKVLVLAGDGDVSKFLATDYLGGLSSDLTLLISQTRSPEVKTKAEEVQADITALKGAADTAKKAVATKLLTDMKALGILMYDVSPFPADIETTSPIEIGAIQADLFNTHTHVGTPAYPCGGSTGVSCNKQPNHGGRTFIQFTKNTCDATDIMVSGANVVAAFSGKVVEKDELHFKIRLEKGGHTYEAVYAHLVNTPADGETVTKGETIGKVGSAGHLHFELSVDNRCVVASPVEAAEATAAETKMGYVVWKKMVTVLRLGS